ncbi:MAG: hypothetical protein FJ293_04995 [Planctomycetes bacterium]|nr:hypothetical protein [Planctomycetota bacterium]
MRERPLHGTRRAAWSGLLLAVLAQLGCGYSAGPLTPAGFRKVHLPLFENQTWYRDLEVELTRQVAAELQSRPGISIVPLGEADIVLAGTIVDFEQRVLSEDSNDRVRESSAVTRVRIEVRDARTGAVRRGFTVRDRAEFLAARGETLAAATAESFFDLARQVVDGLEAGFPRASAAARGAAGATQEATADG